MHNTMVMKGWVVVAWKNMKKTIFNNKKYKFIHI